MAIAYASVQIHSRSKGHSAVAASAYRTRSREYDTRIDTTFDFSHLSDLMFTEMLLPEGAHVQFKDNEYLWNAVEACENRRDAQLCKDVVLALPKELDGVKQIEIAKRFAQVHFVENGLPAEVSIHDHKDGNPHAHILIPTRRLEGDRFSKYKARDLNPKFAKGFIVEQDYWGEQWRDFQDDFFKENALDLCVDLNHVIPERHEGSVRTSNHYVREENRKIRVAREDIVLESVENIINLLSIETSVFTQKDVERLLFKSLKSPQASSQFMGKVQEVLANKNVVALGVNDHGKECFTTRHQYVQEARLLKDIDKLQVRKSHAFDTPLDALILKYGLNEEQQEALSYVVGSGDISCVVGKPGTGKSYLLKPVKLHYETHGCRVLGATIAGKVAKDLEQETGIKTSTIASLNARIVNGSLILTKNDVIVIDEANMVDFSNMSFLVSQVKKARAKLILTGDPMQLNPIKKGGIFKGILDKVGFISLNVIKRQRDIGDRQASIDYSKGKITKTLEHYQRKDAITFGSGDELIANLVDNWVGDKSSMDKVKNHVMLSFTRSSVGRLNQEAREALKTKSLLGQNDFYVSREIKREGREIAQGDSVMVTLTDVKLGLCGGQKAQAFKVKDDEIILKSDAGKKLRVPVHLQQYLQPTENSMIAITQGERLLLTKNDKKIGVRNGDLATVLGVDDKVIVARLDSGNEVVIPRSYKHIDYGYALTVHKSEGMTYDKTSLLIENEYWNKSLGFVGFTRHRDTLNVYVNDYHNGSLEKLGKTLSKEPMQDNVIDWPLNFATRMGFNPDAMVGRSVNKIAGAGHAIKDKFSYVVNYESFVRKQKAKEAVVSRQERRALAKLAADYIDAQKTSSKLYRKTEHEVKSQGIHIQEHPLYERLHHLSQARDKKAYELVQKRGGHLPVHALPDLKPELVERAANRYDQYLIIKEVAAQKEVESAQLLPLAKRVHDKIEISPNDAYINNHLHCEATKNGLSTELLTARIEKYQGIYSSALLQSLRDKNPVLDKYIRTANQRNKLTGLRAEILDKDLSKIAKQIANNKPLTKVLALNFSTLTKSLKKSISLGKGQDIEH